MNNYQIIFYTPETHLQQVKKSMFEAGAGRFKNYEQCAWQTKGEGQFKPINNANPAIGKLKILQTIEEYKVEMFCTELHLKQVIAAMKSAHPYEQIAYAVLKIENL